MPNFKYCQRCRPRSDLRTVEILDGLIRIKQTLSISNYFDAEDNQIILSYESLQQRFEKQLSKEPFPEIGVIKSLFSIPPSSQDDLTVSIDIQTGTDKNSKFIDSLNLSLKDEIDTLKISLLKDLIKIFKPFEADLRESFNERNLNSYMRQKAIPDFSRPAIIRWFHYIDLQLVEALGGLEFCLDAPAWKVEEFCEGILFQLCEEVFDPNNSEHLQIQLEVMKYFSMQSCVG
jgi:hypothetical protein